MARPVLFVVPDPVMRVLLADDQPYVRETIARILRLRAATVIEAADGIELLERLADDGPFDLIVTDVDMGWLCGTHALAAARTAGVTTPALVLSGSGLRELPAQVARLGAAAFLEKPFLLDELDDAIDALVGGADDVPYAVARGSATVTVVP